MDPRRFLQTGTLLLCIAAARETVTVPPCAEPESSQPLADAEACDEGELARYTEALSDQVAGPNKRALVRVEFDDASRVRSVCVDERTGRDTGKARREIAKKLVEMRTLPAGPACVAGRRVDLHRYEAKLAETKYAQNWCGVVVGHRMKALQPCEKFPSDWILYDRVGVTRPYLYVKSEGVQVLAANTLSRCERVARGFEKQSECIQADGFELLTPPRH